MKSENGVEATGLGLGRDGMGIILEQLTHFLQCAGEGLMQERLLQRIERGEFALVEGFETLGLGEKFLNSGKRAVQF